MFSKINALPGSVRVVVWLNLIGAVLSLIAGIAIMQSGPASEVIKNIVSALISFLVVLGILQRSKTVRMLVLVLAWIAVVLFGFALVVALFAAGLAAVVIVIPLVVSVVTVWGLRTEEAKSYFRIGVAEDPYVTRDWLGNPLEKK